MSRRVWSKERITEEIARLGVEGCDITQSHMESIDSKLTSAAIRYFGSWRAAVEAAGIDYESVAAVGRRRRAEKITKWTRETIVDEIRRLYAAGEDLTSTVVRRKYLSLYATARRKDHFGSWSAALGAAGIDYSSLKREASERRRKDPDWREQLLADYHAESPRSRLKAIGGDQGSPAAAPGWARELIRERLAELYERGRDTEEALVRRLQSLIRRKRRPPEE